MYNLYDLLLHLLILVATVLTIVYAFFRRSYRYWEKRNLPYLPPTFPFGNLKRAASVTIGQVMRELYEKSRHERFCGAWMIHKPVLLVNDLDMVKDILVKEFMSFHDHGVYHDGKVDPLSEHLFSIEGAKWRNIRIKMTPTFTSGKMKMMFSTLKQCSDELKDVMRKHAEKDQVVEVKDLIGRFSTDVISSVAFGIETNSLKNPDAKFRVMGRKLFEPTWNMFFRNMLPFMLPEAARFFKLGQTPKDLSDFFSNAMRDVINYRETNNVKRNDFLQLLIQLMNKGYVEDGDSRDENATGDKQKFTLEEALPQAFIFFIGGFETSSTTMQFILYELAVNPEMQEKLRREILDGLNESDGEMTYENVHKMEFMGRVIEETLRKHPPAPFLNRVCTKPYKIPDTDIVIEKGTTVMIPTYGFQMDEKYFPDPEKFDPDRFLEDVKSSRNHYAYLPFGEGPRICIGQRFAMMQVRIALVTVLANFRVSVAEGITTVPVVYDRKAVVLSSKGGMNLRISLL